LKFFGDLFKRLDRRVSAILFLSTTFLYILFLSIFFIVIIKNIGLVEPAVLLHRFKYISAILAFVLILLSVSVAFIIRVQIRLPLKSLLKHIYKGEENTYHGIREFDLIVKNVNKLIINYRDSLTLINNIIYTVGALIVVIDPEKNIYKFNKKCEEITGLSRESVEGKYLWEFVESNKETVGSKILLDLVYNCFISESFYSRVKNHSGDDLTIFWQNTALRDERNEISWMIGTGIDVTETHKAKENLEILNLELEKKVNDRTHMYKEAIQELEKTLNELKETEEQLIRAEKMAALGELVAGVAHEINTPVGIGVTASTHIIEKTGDFIKLFEENSITKTALKEYMTSVQELSALLFTNLKRAGDLINSFKQVSVDQSSEEKRQFNIKEYLREILLSLHPKLKSTKIKVDIECDESIDISGYPGALSQVITNLIINSLTHGYNKNDEGYIKISVFDNQDDEIIIRYTDDGAGISEEIIDKIFDPFFTTKRGSGGSGLGLYIIFNIVTTKFNGSIKCESSLGKGTTFIFNIKKI